MCFLSLVPILTAYKAAVPQPPQLICLIVFNKRVSSDSNGAIVGSVPETGRPLARRQVFILTVHVNPDRADGAGQELPVQIEQTIGLVFKAKQPV